MGIGGLFNQTEGAQTQRNTNIRQIDNLGHTEDEPHALQKHLKTQELATKHKSNTNTYTMIIAKQQPVRSHIIPTFYPQSDKRALLFQTSVGKRRHLKRQK